MDNDLFQQLKLLANSNKIVSIFSSRNCPDTWSSGFIESMSKEHIVLKQMLEIIKKWRFKFPYGCNRNWSGIIVN